MAGKSHEQMATEETQAVAQINPNFTEQRKADGDYPTKAAAAVALRIAGASFEAIAEELNYPNVSAARIAYERVLAATVKDNGDLEHLRALTSRRLESLLLAAWNHATNPEDPDQNAYMRTAVAIIDRHSRLLGLDAPQQMVLHTPDAGRLEEWVAEMVRQVGPGGVAEEADIIDAQIVEGDDA